MWKDFITTIPPDQKIVATLEQSSTYIPTFVYSVMEKTITGTMYSNSNSTYMVETKNGLYYVSGDENDALFLHFLKDLYVSRKRKGLRTTIFSPSPKWNQVLEQFPRVKEWKRNSYTWVSGDVHKRFVSDYNRQRINQETISISSLFDDEYYKEYWGSAEQFLKRGGGYCMIDQNEVVSECTSIFSNSRFSELDIATVDGYQGKGLAKDLARTFILECLSNQVMPRWECDVHHKVSNKLADKLGFGNTVAYSVFT